MYNSCLFTVDVEEWWSVESFREFLSHKENQMVHYTDRIGAGLDKILSLLEQYKIRGLFFVLGRVAEKHPKEIQKIVQKGHEIGTHGYDHILVYNQTPQEFEKDLLQSIHILEKVTSQKINKYRAPSYSITSDSLWALSILAKHGIEYDFSLFPAKNKRFGITSAEHKPYQVITEYKNKTMVEFPPNIINLGLIKLPINSGFGFRLFPLFLIKMNLNKLFKKGVLPNFIIHNWELDDKQPKIKTDMKGRLIHYYNIRQTDKKLKRIFERYSFISPNQLGQPIKKLDLSELSNNKE